MRCERCAFISWSERRHECWWYARCNLDQLQPDDDKSAQTLQLRPALERLPRTLSLPTEDGSSSGGGSGGGGSSSSRSSSSSPGTSRTVGIVSHFAAPRGSRARRPGHPLAILRNISLRNHLAYAHHFGYQHLGASSCMASPSALEAIVPVPWAKVFLLEACFDTKDEIEQLLWLDADVIVTNGSLSLDAIASMTKSDSCDVVVGADEGVPFNTGVMLLRRSESTRRLLRALTLHYNSSRRVAMNWEQTALHTMWRDEAWVRRALCVVPRRPYVQSFVKFDEHRAGDFAAHFSLSSKERIQDFWGGGVLSTRTQKERYSRSYSRT